ncbi:MAG: hypothetical protein V4697_02985 [Patescibacteria group bacterium]
MFTSELQNWSLKMKELVLSEFSLNLLSVVQTILEVLYGKIEIKHVSICGCKVWGRLVKTDFRSPYPGGGYPKISEDFQVFFRGLEEWEDRHIPDLYEPIDITDLSLYIGYRAWWDKETRTARVVGGKTEPSADFIGTSADDRRICINKHSSEKRLEYRMYEI